MFESYVTAYPYQFLDLVVQWCSDQLIEDCCCRTKIGAFKFCNMLLFLLSPVLKKRPTPPPPAKTPLFVPLIFYWPTVPVAANSSTAFWSHLFNKMPGCSLYLDNLDILVISSLFRLVWFSPRAMGRPSLKQFSKYFDYFRSIGPVHSLYSRASYPMDFLLGPPSITLLTIFAN